MQTQPIRPRAVNLDVIANYTRHENAEQTPQDLCCCYSRILTGVKLSGSSDHSSAWPKLLLSRSLGPDLYVLWSRHCCQAFGLQQGYSQYQGIGGRLNIWSSPSALRSQLPEQRTREQYLHEQSRNLWA